METGIKGASTVLESIVHKMVKLRKVNGRMAFLNDGLRSQIINERLA